MSSTEGRILFLGTGASTGVPVVNCACKVCSSKNPRNMRLRPGILVSMKGKTFLFDAGPDFRHQALLHKIARPDALFLTHTHYDHVGGLEELRAFSYHNYVPIPCYLSQESFESVKKLFYYLFLPKSSGSNKTAELDFHVLDGAEGSFLCNGIQLNYFSYSHGSMNVTGYRIGPVAYVTDIKEFSTSIFQALTGVDLLILSATCFKHSHLHMTIDEAVAFAKKIAPKKTYFVHMSHEIEYESVSSNLPTNIELAYDGLEITFPWKDA